MATNPIVHVDFPAEDAKAAAQFYKAAFGWNLVYNEEFSYWMFSAEGGPGGGFVGVGDEGPVKNEIGKVLVYLGSEDIDADLARVESLGGRIIAPRMPIGEIGAMAIFADPSGNVLGFFQDMMPKT